MAVSARPLLGDYLWLFLRFRGRIERAPFVLACLLSTAILIFAVVKLVNGLPPEFFEQLAAERAPMPVLPDTPQIRFWAFFELVAGAFWTWSLFALIAKRLHDIGLSGWWGLSFLIGGLIIVVILAVIPGGSGPNRYGPAPDRRLDRS